MNKIEPTHLKRDALVYIRQSSMTQVRNNLESQKLQYDLVNRAKALGWKNPVVVDEDLGKSAAGGHLRSGFEFLLQEVQEGRVGAVFAVEASRLSRCGSEWHRLIEHCMIVDTLIIDHQSIHDPKLADDSFLLGLKGSMSKMEVNLLVARTRSASLEKARRGELYVHVPTGFVLLPGNQLVKDPDKRVQNAINTVFEIFSQMRTIGKTTRKLRESKIEIPVAASRNGSKELEWSLPRYSRIRGIITNPFYAGTYVYGRTRRQAQIKDGTKIIKVKKLALEDALVVLENHRQGYISVEQYNANKQILKDNQNTEKETKPSGAPRQGAAMLAGLVRCGRCGCRLVVRYYGDNGGRAAYFCNRNSKITGTKRCMYCNAAQIDREVEGRMLEAISPLGVAAALQAHAKSLKEVGALEETCRLRLKQHRYEADRAARQYNLSDPENRLVTAELEKRWNQALEQVAASEADLERIGKENHPLTSEQSAELTRLGEDFEQAWNHPDAPVEIKKRIVRAVIEEVLITKEDKMLEVTIHWKGGDHSRLTLQARKQVRKTDPRAVEIVEELNGVISREQIAEVLNKEKLTTGAGLGWTAKRVGVVTKQIRSAKEPRVRVEQAAQRLGIGMQTATRLVAQGKLRGHRVSPAAPVLIKESNLSEPRVLRTIADLKAGKNAAQLDLDFEDQKTTNCAL